MKKECLFTPKQKQVVVDKSYEFGKFFANKDFIDNWEKPSQTEFENRLKNRPVKSQSKQLGILFAYNIIKKDFDYFIKNRKFDFDKYFSSKTQKGWSGFAYYIFQTLKELQSDEEVQYFFEELYNTILD